MCTVSNFPVSIHLTNIYRTSLFGIFIIYLIKYIYTETWLEQQPL